MFMHNIFILTLYLAIFDILSGMYFDVLSDILFGIYSDILSGILSGIYSDILSGNHSGILFGMCSGPGVPHNIRACRASWAGEALLKSQGPLAGE
jgi:hypothetical protein